jgi:hypothetical protein
MLAACIRGRSNAACPGQRASFASESSICAGVPSKRRPQPHAKSVSPQNTMPSPMQRDVARGVARDVERLERMPSPAPRSGRPREARGRGPRHLARRAEGGHFHCRQGRQSADVVRVVVRGEDRGEREAAAREEVLDGRASPGSTATALAVALQIQM